MKVSVNGLNSAIAQGVKQVFGESMANEQVPCMGFIYTDSVYLDYDVAENHRPYMVVTGTLDKLTGDFPKGVTELTFCNNNRRVEYRYNFTDSELGVLASKGIYNKGYSMSNIMSGILIEFPIEVDYAAIYEDDIPIVFIGISNPYNLETSSALSGYTNMVDYFDTYVQPDVVKMDVELLNDEEMVLDKQIHKDHKESPKIEKVELVVPKVPTSEEELIGIYKIDELYDEVLVGYQEQSKGRFATELLSTFHEPKVTEPMVDSDSDLDLDDDADEIEDLKRKEQEDLEKARLLGVDAANQEIVREFTSIKASNDSELDHDFE